MCEGGSLRIHSTLDNLNDLLNRRFRIHGIFVKAVGSESMARDNNIQADVKKLDKYLKG